MKVKFIHSVCLLFGLLWFHTAQNKVVQKKVTKPYATLNILVDILNTSHSASLSFDSVCTSHHITSHFSNLHLHTKLHQHHKTHGMLGSFLVSDLIWHQIMLDFG